MPIHDWKCQGCGAEILDRYQPRTEGLESFAPECPNKDKLQQVRELSDSKTIINTEFHKMERQWTTNKMRRTFEGFDFDADNGEIIHIGSMHKLREVERLSEERYRQGFGRPFNFRAYSQEPSNMDSSAYGRNEVPQIDKSRMNRIKINRGKG